MPKKQQKKSKVFNIAVSISIVLIVLALGFMGYAMRDNIKKVFVTETIVTGAENAASVTIRLSNKNCAGENPGPYILYIRDTEENVEISSMDILPCDSADDALAQEFEGIKNYGEVTLMLKAGKYSAILAKQGILDEDKNVVDYNANAFDLYTFYTAEFEITEEDFGEEILIILEVVEIEQTESETETV